MLWVVVTQSADLGITGSRVHGPYKSWEKAESERLALYENVNPVTVSDSMGGDFLVSAVVQCTPGEINIPMYQQEWIHPQDPEGANAG